MGNIAIIPARSGSKGLKDKNIKKLNGIPLLAYTITSAIKSGCFDEVYVSTDSEEYARIAIEYGASVPFLRSEQNSTDTASSWDCVREAINGYEKLGKNFELCMLLQPTSPLRDEKDIINAFNLFNDKNAKAVISVCELEHPFQWSFKLDKNASMKDFSTSPYRNSRRQDLTPHYRENGAMYLTSTKSVLNKQFDIYLDGCYAYVMSKNNSIDIDTALDFQIAEILMCNR